MTITVRWADGAEETFGPVLYHEVKEGVLMIWLGAPAPIGCADIRALPSTRVPLCSIRQYHVQPGDPG
jgi:hypothetical protein